MEIIKIQDIEKEYRNRIIKKYGGRNNFTIDEILEISLELFNELKIERSEDDEDYLMFESETSMLNKGIFKVHIYRLIHIPEDEPFQIGIVLSYNIKTKSEGEYNYLDTLDDEDIGKWIENIKKTDAYELVKNINNDKFEIYFSNMETKPEEGENYLELDTAEDVLKLIKKMEKMD